MTGRRDDAGGVSILRVDTLDGEGSELVELAVREPEPFQLVIDLTGAGQVGPNAVGALLDVMRTVRRRRGEVVVCAGGQTATALSDLGLDSVVTLSGSLQEAFRLFGRSPGEAA